MIPITLLSGCGLVPSDLTSFINTIRYFTKMTDPDVMTDDTITSFIRMGEERISSELRNADMVQIDTATFGDANRVKLPTDYQSMDFIRWADATSANPLHFQTRDDFYSLPQPDWHYTTSGLYLMVGGGDNTGRVVELHYFGDVPALQVGSDTWLTRRYPSLLTSATMVAASKGMVDVENAPLWEADCAAAIQRLNDNYKSSIARGSKLRRVQKGFG